MPAINGANVENNKSPPKTSRKVAKRPTGKQASSASSGSESSDSSDTELLPEEPSPIPPTRPTDPVDAIRYDTFKAVWHPRNRRPGAEKIKNAMVAFNDVVTGVRDTWKEKSRLVKMSENKGDGVKADELKKDVLLHRRLMDAVACTALERGHPAIIEKYVLSFYHISCLKDPCHGHKSQKRTRSLSCVILLSLDGLLFGAFRNLICE